MKSAAPPIELVSGSGSMVRASDGREFVDLVIGFGAAFLGHGHAAIAAALRRQVDAGIWNCGRQLTPLNARVDELLAAVLPAGLSSLGLYSTGNEVAEFAFRLAAVHTGRSEFAAFERSMHGKSAYAAALCWSNSPLRPSALHTLSASNDANGVSMLESLDGVLAGRRVAALFVEPLQGSNGGREMAPELLERVIETCRRHGTLCVFDEILTGLYRTGPAFCVERLAQLPDIVLFAKSMGNGFPVSAIAARPSITADPRSLPGSTFAGNALALAAVEATLSTMLAEPMVARVAEIERCVLARLSGLEADGLTLRGRGAIWALELDPAIAVERAQLEARSEGVLVSAAGSALRLLPAATIEIDCLDRACAAVWRACLAARRSSSR